MPHKVRRRPMTPKILQVHNRYLRPGGEDTVLAEEYKLLQENRPCC